MDDYAAFLATKRIEATPAGFDPTFPLNPHSKPFQAYCTTRALRMGRSGLWAGTGLGKSMISMDWASHVARHTGKPTLIVAPLGVARQFEREAEKFNIDGVAVFKEGAGFRKTRIVVTNYERLHKFNPRIFGGVVCDEAGCLKAYEGVFRKQITEFAKAIPYRLAATATPAPNDLLELANQAEFLDAMTVKEVIACFFTQDGNSTQSWRLKKHAADAWWKWVATWATAFRKPSDLGFDDGGYVLPPLNIINHSLDSKPMPGYLIPVEAHGLREQRAAKRASLSERVDYAASLANGESSEPWVCWAELNDESEALRRAIPGSAEVRGTDSIEDKEEKFAAFADGRLRVLITKPVIAAWGLNWQHCARTVVVGVGNSYEQQFQLIRRFWRFGQTRPVDVHLIASEAEGAILANLRRKDAQATEMFERLVRHMAPAETGRTSRDVAAYEPAVEMTIPQWLRSEAMA